MPSIGGGKRFVLLKKKSNDRDNEPFLTEQYIINDGNENMMGLTGDGEAALPFLSCEQ